MTPEEARSLRVGDVVLVRAIVQADFSKARYVPMATADEAPCNFNVYPDAIHSVLPRPLEVGDRVKMRDLELPACAIGTVLAAHDPRVWVIFDGYLQPADCAASELERVSQ